MYGYQAPPPPPREGGGAGPIIAIVAAVFAVLVLFAAVLVAVVLWFRARAATPVTGPFAPPATTYASGGPSWSDSTSPVPITSADPMRGDSDALVTIVVFSDFQCPFCQRLETTLTDVTKSYRSDEVRILWKHNPLAFHPQAKPASIAAEGVFQEGGNKAFWEFHDQVFA